MELLVSLSERTQVNYYRNEDGSRTMDAIKSHNPVYMPKERWNTFDWH